MSADKGQYEVMYLEKGDSKELFSQPMTYEGVEWAARKLSREGFDVIAIVTAEHAAERRERTIQNGTGGILPGAHLTAFVNDIVRRFRRDYPGVPRESALEVIGMLCKLSQQAPEVRDLQTALLNEIHDLGASDDKWRLDMRIAIANRRPEGE